MMRIAIVATAGESLIKFRRHLIKEWVKRNCEVWCISIEDPCVMKQRISELGAEYCQVSGNRTGTSIVDGIGMIHRYKKAFKKIKPDLCFLYMSKPVAFGGIAAIQCKIPRIVVFQTGLEIAFYSAGLKNLFIRQVLKILFKYVHGSCETVFFMCHEDERKMLKWGLVNPEQVCYVDGSGVDMNHFARTDLPGEAIVLMVARLVWSKGIREYLEAARLVKKKHPEVRFLLVGGIDENSEALSKREVNELRKEGVIEYKGYHDDVRPYLEECSIFVLPSYHEGKGTAILEAQSVGRPVITTTAPGCSETVIEGYNGLLVPVKNARMLADRIEYLVVHPEERQRMADHAYQFCKKKFESGIICSSICERLKIKEESK